MLCKVAKEIENKLVIWKKAKKIPANLQTRRNLLNMINEELFTVEGTLGLRHLQHFLSILIQNCSRNFL